MREIHARSEKKGEMSPIFLLKEKQRDQFVDGFPSSSRKLPRPVPTGTSLFFRDQDVEVDTNTHPRRQKTVREQCLQHPITWMMLPDAL